MVSPIFWSLRWFSLPPKPLSPGVLWDVQATKYRRGGDYLRLRLDKCVASVQRTGGENGYPYLGTGLDAASVDAPL